MRRQAELPLIVGAQIAALAQRKSRWRSSSGAGAGGAPVKTLA
jgi:hypothetical protein